MAAAMIVDVIWFNLSAVGLATHPSLQLRYRRATEIFAEENLGIVPLQRAVPAAG
jgi:hypothetical protein